MVKITESFKKVITFELSKGEVVTNLDFLNFRIRVGYVENRFYQEEDPVVVGNKTGIINEDKVKSCSEWTNKETNERYIFVEDWVNVEEFINIQNFDIIIGIESLEFFKHNDITGGFEAVYRTDYRGLYVVVLDKNGKEVKDFKAVVLMKEK